MNWWEWLITGLFGGAGGLASLIAGATMLAIKHAEVFMPRIMRMAHQHMITREAKRKNADSTDR